MSKSGVRFAKFGSKSGRIGVASKGASDERKLLLWLSGSKFRSNGGSLLEVVVVGVAVGAVAVLGGVVGEGRPLEIRLSLGDFVGVSSFLRLDVSSSLSSSLRRSITSTRFDFGGVVGTGTFFAGPGAQIIRSFVRNQNGIRGELGSGLGVTLCMGVVVHSPDG